MTFVAGDPKNVENGRLAAKSPRHPANTGVLAEARRKTHFGTPGGADPVASGKKAHENGWVGRMTPQALQKSHEVRKNMPAATSGNFISRKNEFQSFAAKIRYITNDGWQLIDSVYEVFTRAREAHAEALIMESATWLADRGFGKPVQVGQLLDAEGNAVAFTLWQPVAPVGLPAPNAEEGPDVIEHEAIQRPPEEYKHPARAIEEIDALSAGPLKAWTTSKVDPLSGEET